MENAKSTTYHSRIFPDKLHAYYQLTKPGITFTVVTSMVIGFIMGTAGSLNLPLLFHATLGTYLIAAGTAARNMFLERNLDSLMRRTRKRPLPAYKLSARESHIFSVSMIFGGLAYLLIVVNPVAGLISLATTAIYLYVYTPLKRISALNVFVGAIPGALPVVGGWAAATGTVFEHGMWILFGIVYCWQIPHVMAIAWVCRNDYEHAGFKMLPKNDPKGFTTALWVMVPLLILFPTVYKFYVMDLANWLYLAGALFTTAGFFYYGLRFTISRNMPTARALMFASFVYLPLIWVFIFADWLFM